jgi:hypothetical protein
MPLYFLGRMRVSITQEGMIMKRWFVAGNVLLVLALLSGMALAQGFGGLPIPGLSFPGGSRCSVWKAKEAIVTFDVSGNMQHVELGLGATGAPLLTSVQTTHRYEVGGVLFGATAAVPVTDAVSLLADFRLLVPFNGVDSQGYDLVGGATGSRDWNTTNQWYTVDGMVGYAVNPALTCIAGFRFDQFTTSFKDGSGISGIPGLATDEAELVVNGYVPFIGVQASEGSATRVLSFRLIGWPKFWGDVRYNETLGGTPILGPVRTEGLGFSYGGYFLEAAGEYDFQVGKGANAGLFATFTNYHGNGNVNRDAQGLGGATLASGDFDLSLNRFSWSIGAKLDIPFSSPL